MSNSPSDKREEMESSTVGGVCPCEVGIVDLRDGELAHVDIFHVCFLLCLEYKEGCVSGYEDMAMGAVGTSDLHGNGGWS
jgi:hypothetical protein